MRFPVEYRGQEAGFVEATQDIHGIQFEATCTLHTQEVVRLYAQAEERSFKIGVLEPENGGLHLKRLWTPETLRSFQITELPRRYYIDDGRPGLHAANSKPHDIVATGPANATSSGKRRCLARGCRRRMAARAL